MSGQRLAGKVAVITGAASGIGEATAERFATEGAAVLLADIQDDEAAVVLARIRNRGGRAEYRRCDVSVEDDVRGAIAAAEAGFGGLDIVFNNAGISGRLPIEDMSEAFWDRMMAVDLKSVMFGCKHAVPALRRRGGGSIISTSSTAGLRAGSLNAYGVAKAGVIHLTKAVAWEVGRHGIRVNCICPGITETNIWRSTVNLAPDERAARFRQMGTSALLNRTGKPEDIANAALFLASDESSYITGHALVVDGGLTAGGRAPTAAR
jgi:NAD(P)-dependent dehydrogenase (short-subunit alcohol dehydrogenase family)